VTLFMFVVGFIFGVVFAFAGIALAVLDSR
jgi:hypothetical protein